MDVTQELIALHESQMLIIDRMIRTVELIKSILIRVEALENRVIVNAGEYYAGSKS